MSETQMGHGHTAGLLGIIIKICLGIHIGVVADDLDGVLVRANGTVCAKAPEFAVDGSFGSGNDGLAQLKRQVGHIIHDADGKSLLRMVLINGNDLRRRGVLGTKTVTAGEYRNLIELGALKSSHNVQIQRLADGARLLGPVKNGDLLYGIRDRSDKRLGSERTVQANFYNAYLLALLCQIVDGLLDRVVDGTHGNNHMLRVCGAVIVEQLIVGADLGIYLVHVLLHDRRKRVVVRIAGLSYLEEDIRVLSGASLAGVVGIQRSLTELVDGVHIRHLLQILIIPGLNFLNFMGGTESIEEVDERNLALDRCQMSNRSQVHYFLNAGLAEHRAASLTARVNIGMVAKDRKSVGRQSTGRYVEYARKLLAGDLIQVRDHQQKTLGSRIGGG